MAKREMKIWTADINCKFKNKKTIGRAIVGAQSGGLKALSETKINYYLIINYTNKVNETDVFSFNVYMKNSKIVDYVNSMIKKDTVVDL